MKNKLTVIIPSRPNIENIQWIFHSLDIQTFQDFKIILLIDTKLTKEEFEKFKIDSLKWLKNISNKINFISNINTDFIPQSWVSYVRNYGIKLADTEFINLFDDDELFKSDYLQKTFDIRNEINKKFTRLIKGVGEFEKQKKKLQPPPIPTSRETQPPQVEEFLTKGSDFILVPTLMFRKTWQIQSQWFDYYNFWTSRPHALRLQKDQKLAQIQMYSWNSLFGPTKIFQEILFDERLDFVYEDLEFTYRIYKAWYPIFVSSELLLYHMERDKNILEHARVWNTFAAYRKAKHRMIFVKKNWTLSDKIKFYLIWFRAQPLRLSFKVMMYAKRNEKLKIIWSIIKWTLDWIKS